jgi:inorganic pyrophosphatase
MTDESGPDAKLVVVPATDPRWQQVRDLEDVDQFLRDEISQFFEVYKLLEPGKHARIEGWRDRAAAERELQAAYDRYPTA